MIQSILEDSDNEEDNKQINIIDQKFNFNNPLKIEIEKSKEKNNFSNKQIQNLNIQGMKKLDTNLINKKNYS